MDALTSMLLDAADDSNSLARVRQKYTLPLQIFHRLMPTPKEF